MTIRIGSICLAPYRHEAFDKISRHLNQCSTDLLLISGFRTGLQGMMLRGHLDRLGLVYQTPSDTNPDEDALILGSRFPFVQRDLPEKIGCHRRNCVNLCVSNLNLIAYEVTPPTLGSPLEDYLLTQASQLQRHQTLFMGRCTDDEGPNADSLAGGLVRLGYLNAARFHTAVPINHMAPSPSPPFHAHVTPALAPQLSDCFRAGDPVTRQQENLAMGLLRMG